MKPKSKKNISEKIGEGMVRIKFLPLFSLDNIKKDSEGIAIVTLEKAEHIVNVKRIAKYI